MKAIIKGGGIGGLTAALCLLKQGWNVAVFEKSELVDDAGAGIQISPNASRVFEQLGILDALKEKTFMPESLELRLGKSGRQIFNIPLANYAEQRWQAPYLHIHRADLLTVLASHLEQRSPSSLKLNCPIKAVSQNASGVTAELNNSTTEQADLLIAADGIHSQTQAQLFGASKPRFTGNVAWRAVIPISRLQHIPPPTACVWAGPGKHAVTYRLRGGELVNFVGVVETQAWQEESWTAKGTKDQALEDFSGWHPTIVDIIEKADEHFKWALFDRPTLDSWAKGRITLLGDSCHPMLPFLAQGAAQAIEDAWVLSQTLPAINGNLTLSQQQIEGSLSDYYHRRIKRVTKVQAGARANMKTFHHRSKAAQFFHYGPMWLASRIAPTLVHQRQDWLYGAKL